MIVPEWFACNQLLGRVNHRERQIPLFSNTNIALQSLNSFVCIRLTIITKFKRPILSPNKSISHTKTHSNTPFAPPSHQITNHSLIKRVPFSSCRSTFGHATNLPTTYLNMHTKEHTFKILHLRPVPRASFGHAGPDVGREYGRMCCRWKTKRPLKLIIVAAIIAIRCGRLGERTPPLTSAIAFAHRSICCVCGCGHGAERLNWWILVEFGHFDGDCGGLLLEFVCKV